MTLAAGRGVSLEARTCLGPYEIVSAAGAGGMGEVYKARDTRLGRTVALKVLPAEAAADPERRRRFEQEARAVSALNHPHICVLHDIGSDGDVHFLVMEYLDGETLAERLKRGPLSLAQTLEYGAQIADALNRAHRQGIVHRDLKPSNVMLTGSGAKLLDFGVAKLKGAEPSASTSVTGTGWPLSDPITAGPTILGTISYMAPEQLEGGDVDARADLFAFGAVLYEMLTARRAFEGKSPASVIASILAGEPPRLLEVRPLAPTAVARVIATCLEKDPNDRWQTAHDLRLQLEAIADDAGTGRRWRGASLRRLRWPATIALLLSSIGLAGWLIRGRPLAAPGPSVRFTIALPSGASFGDQPNLAVSPDGRYLAYTAKLRGSSTRLWLRAMDATESRELPETAGAQFPFWAPDSQAVGFISGGALRRIDLQDAKPRVIATLSPQQQVGSAAWGPGDVVVFASGTALFRVPAQGGEATLIAERPQRFRGIRGFMPDGRALVSEWDAAASFWSAFAVPLDRSGSVAKIAGGFAVHAGPERLLLVRDGMLIAQPFDSRTQRTHGDPTMLAEAVDAWDAAASGEELLVYRPRPRTQLAWFDRAGRRVGTLGSPETDYLWLSVSPDGARAAVERGRPIEVGDIWLFDLARPSAPLRLGTRGARQSDPVWSGDGRHVAYASIGAGRNGIYRRSVGGNEELIIQLDTPAWPTDWTADGRHLVVATPAFGQSGSSMDVAIIATEGGQGLQPLLATEANEAQARVSPDGRWIAYTSDESGRPEVYVQRFPEPGERIGVSVGGGAQPAWRRDGRELFYLDLDRRLMSVPMQTGLHVNAGTPRPLFELPSYGFDIFYGVRNVYDVAPDGNRFLVLTRDEREASSLTVVTNFIGALAAPRD
jgi:Tol biopolymer transport system component